MVERHTFRRAGLAIAASLFLFGGSAALAEDNPRVAGEIMELARAQWAAEIAGKSASEQMASVADDYTEFNPDYPTRIDGKAMALRMTDVVPGDKAMFSDMQNPKVQVYGDTAILTYNFAGIRRDNSAKTSSNIAKSTRVYVRQGGKWMLVHANFAPVPAPSN